MGLTPGMLPGSWEQSQPKPSLAVPGDASPQGACEIQVISTPEPPHPRLLCDFQDRGAALVSNAPAMLFAMGQEGALHPGAPKVKLPPRLGLSCTGTAAGQGHGTHQRWGSCPGARSAPSPAPLILPSLKTHPGLSQCSPDAIPSPVSSTRGQPCSVAAP